MASQYPGGVDNFTEPSTPESTPLSSAGSGQFNHYEHHKRLGEGVTAVQKFAAKADHDHSGGSGDNDTDKLKQANTHESPDTDSAPTALHHTLGTGANQAARGNHTHDANSMVNQAFMICTSTTRPVSPYLGLQIYETDTNRIRVWAQFPSATAPRWTLLTSGAVPIVRLTQGTAQKIPQAGAIIEWRNEVEDNFGFFNSAQSMTDIVFNEPGLYSVDTAITWNNTDIFGDRALTCLTLNGQETTYRQFEFIRGGSIFNPGFPQTVAASAKIRLAVGDRLGVKAGHNGSSFQFTYSNTSNKQDSRIEISYIAP